MHTSASSPSTAPHTAAQSTDFTQPATALHSSRAAGQLQSSAGHPSVAQVPPGCAKPAYSIWKAAHGSGGGGIAGAAGVGAGSPGPSAFPPQPTKLSAPKISATPPPPLRIPSSLLQRTACVYESAHPVPKKAPTLWPEHPPRSPLPIATRTLRDLMRRLGAAGENLASQRHWPVPRRRRSNRW